MLTRCENEVDRLPHVPHCAPMIPRGEVLLTCVNGRLWEIKSMKRMHMINFLL